MKKVLLASLVCFSSLTFANDNLERMQNTYDKAYSNASISCEYYYYRNVPRIVTLSQNYSKLIGATAELLVNGKLINIGITSGGTNGIVSFEVDGVKFDVSLKSRGGVKKINHFKIDLKNLTEEQKLMSEHVQLSDMDCSVDIGMENHHNLFSEKVHISMHPHFEYDLDGESIPGTLRELAKPAQHLMLFDDTPKNLYKAISMNFNSFMSEGVTDLKNRPFSPPKFDIPRQVPLRLSQAGHNRYTLTRPHHEITYTGGNHNFCILNNTRRLLHGFMENPNSESIVFKFPLDAIVVQRGSWLNGGKFPKSALKYSNMLSKVFPAMTKEAVKKYLDSYYNYFSWSYLKEKKHFFATATFRQVLDGEYERVETIEGLGEGHIDITFEYVKAPAEEEIEKAEVVTENEVAQETESEEAAIDEKLENPITQ